MTDLTPRAIPIVDRPTISRPLGRLPLAAEFLRRLANAAYRQHLFAEAMEPPVIVDNRIAEAGSVASCEVLLRAGAHARITVEILEAAPEPTPRPSASDPHPAPRTW